MDAKTEGPKTLKEAIEYFADPERCFAYAVKLRWPEGKVTCPHCGSDQHWFIARWHRWQCKGCKKQFTLKIGTIFEDSPLGMDKWLAAIWLLAKSGSIMKASGEVEVDETFIGGKARNMHIAQRKRRITGTGGKAKTAVVGFVERGGKVQTVVVENRKKKTLQEEVKKRVEAGSALYTDELLSYEGLEGQYAHQVINHAVAYVEGKVHTNTLENFWSLLKRGLHGTYVSVEPFHLHRYLDEQVFRYNNRKDLDDAGRFEQVMAQVAGRRLTYNKLAGKEHDPRQYG